MTFAPPRRRAHLIGSPPDHLSVEVPGGGTLSVRRASSLRYLGVFLSDDLSWDNHVKIMANRARSTVRALSVLGNTVRGLDFANWRRVYPAIILPVLLYGLPLWSTRRPKSLLRTLQTAQNDAMRPSPPSFPPRFPPSSSLLTFFGRTLNWRLSSPAPPLRPSRRLCTCRPRTRRTAPPRYTYTRYLTPSITSPPSS